MNRLLNVNLTDRDQICEFASQSASSNLSSVSAPTFRVSQDRELKCMDILHGPLQLGNPHYAKKTKTRNPCPNDI